jgi:hypothetical protein
VAKVKLGRIKHMRYLPVVLGGVFCALSTSASADSATLCGQKVEYSLVAPSAEITGKSRGVSGVWAGEHIAMARGDGREFARCIAIVIERIDSGGVASGRYVAGDSARVLNNGNKFALKPFMVNWRGKVTGDVLRIENNVWAYELQLTDTNQMRGKFTDEKGIGPTWLKRQ